MARVKAQVMLRDELSPIDSSILPPVYIVLDRHCSHHKLAYVSYSYPLTRTSSQPSPPFNIAPLPQPVPIEATDIITTSPYLLASRCHPVPAFPHPFPKP